MGKFLTPLDVKVLGDRNFEVVNPLVFRSDDGNDYTVPVGQTTDFASVWGIPLVSEVLSGKANMAATLHDWCYRTGCVPRKKADELLWEAALAEESNLNMLEREFIANALYVGVREGGRSAYQGKPEWND